MKKQYLFLLLLSILLLSSMNAQEENNKQNLEPRPSEELREANYTIDMFQAKPFYSKNADTLFFRFRIIEKQSNKKVTWANLNKENYKIDCKENGENSPNKDIIINRIVSKEGEQAKRISENVSFLFLVDRSKTITAKDMDSMKFAIKKTIENLPDSCAYISFFDKNVTEKKLITKNNFSEFEKEFKVKNETKNIFSSIISSFEAFAKDSIQSKKNTDEVSKYLLIFTDGRMNVNSADEIIKLTKHDKSIEEIDNNYSNKIQIHAFRYGKNNTNRNTLDLPDNVLETICLHRRKIELRGWFYPAENVAGMVDSLRGVVENLYADYDLMLVNKEGKVYNGRKICLQISISKDKNQAVGEISYTIGSKEMPVETGKKPENIYIAIIFGLIFIFIAFFIMQVVIPYLIFRNSNFEKKYVRNYQPISNGEEEIYEICSYCQEPFERAEMIVTKCSHKIHWDCWKENGYKCVEYGQNCKDGIQHHFDNRRPFDLKKSPYYLKWAMSGMITGFFTWIIFEFTKSITLFPNFINYLLNAFYPENLKTEIEGIMQISSSTEAAFHTKITGSLLVGVLLGFFLTLLFSYLNDFRQKKGKVIFITLFRALIGAIIGFITFIAASLISIKLGEGSNNLLIDVISWILFGGGIALCLVPQTTIKWQDALIGGIISGIVSCLILYTTHLLPILGVMFGFMLCSAGVGVSIIARHRMAQKYFLLYISGRREGEIAIHKWMNESGGSNEVTIGKSNQCVIQMNWDNSDRIQDKQAKLYIDPKRRVPMLKVLENGMIYDGREGRKDELYHLKNNVKFVIGNTEFQYVEK